VLSNVVNKISSGVLCSILRLIAAGLFTAFHHNKKRIGLSGQNPYFISIIMHTAELQQDLQRFVVTWKSSFTDLREVGFVISECCKNRNGRKSLSY
jgi:hypothetical protein